MIEKTRVLGAPGRWAAWLIMRHGRRVGQDFRLGRMTYMGREGERCDVVLDDHSVSSRHACVKLEQSRFYLYDLASRNGTFVNGLRVEEPRLLDDGDEIRIGRTRLIFKQVSL